MRHAPLTRIITAAEEDEITGMERAPIDRSKEGADLLLVGVERGLFLRLEEALGMDSPFLRETGAFAHPVGLGTITVPLGWEERLVAFGREEGLANVWALEIHDLAATKLMAGREKDFEFLRALLDLGLCDFSLLLTKFQSFRIGVFRNAVGDRLGKLAKHLRAWNRDDLACAITKSADE